MRRQHVVLNTFWLGELIVLALVIVVVLRETFRSFRSRLR
jgi:hypothetical protein